MAEKCDVVIIGGGAAGLMCARVAGRRGRSVLILDHAKRPAEKFAFPAGRCNFTNMHSSPAAFCQTTGISANRHLPAIRRMILSSLSPNIRLPFTKSSASCSVMIAPTDHDMLLAECRDAQAELRLNTSVSAVSVSAQGYHPQTSGRDVTCSALVVATGGLSIPKIGATRFGYDIARQFGLRVTAVRPALVPLTFQDQFLARCKALSGLSVDAEIRHGKTIFREGLLFTHRGPSGPSILQISSYWQDGAAIHINLLPDGIARPC